MLWPGMVVPARARGGYALSKKPSQHWPANGGQCYRSVTAVLGTAVPAMIWPRILVFTSMMLRVLAQQPLAVMELEFIFLSWDWFPSMYVLFDLSQICMICWRAKLSYQFSSGTAKGAYGNSPKGGVFPGTSCSTFESNQWIVVIPRRP